MRLERLTFQQITVGLTPDEMTLLKQLAAQDCRPTPWQVAWLIRQEAARRGLLELDATQERSDEAVDVEEQQRTTK